MKKRALSILFVGWVVTVLALGGCQSFPGTKKKKDFYGKDFQQRVAQDPFPQAGTVIR